MSVPSYLAEDLPNFCPRLFQPTSAQLTIPSKELDFSKLSSVERFSTRNCARRAERTQSFPVRIISESDIKRSLFTRALDVGRMVERSRVALREWPVPSKDNLKVKYMGGLNSNTLISIIIDKEGLGVAANPPQSGRSSKGGAAHRKRELTKEQPKSEKSIRSSSIGSSAAAGDPSSHRIEDSEKDVNHYMAAAAAAIVASERKSMRTLLAGIKCFTALRHFLDSRRRHRLGVVTSFWIRLYNKLSWKHLIRSLKEFRSAAALLSPKEALSLEDDRRRIAKCKMAILSFAACSSARVRVVLLRLLRITFRGTKESRGASDVMHSEYRNTAKPLIRSYIRSARYSNRAKSSRQRNGLLRFLRVGESDALGFLQRKGRGGGGEEDCSLVPQYGGEIDPVTDSVLYLYSNSSFDADLLGIREASVAVMSSSRAPPSTAIEIAEVVEGEEGGEVKEEDSSEDKKVEGEGRDAKEEENRRVEKVANEENEEKKEEREENRKENEAKAARALEWEAFTATLIPLDEVDLYRCGSRQGTHPVAIKQAGMGKKKGKAKGKPSALSVLTPAEMRAQLKGTFSAVKEHMNRRAAQ